MIDRESNQPEQLLDVDQVAALLGLHQQTIYTMARSGELRGIRAGRSWRFRPSDVRAWQEEKAAAAPAPQPAA